MLRFITIRDIMDNLHCHFVFMNKGHINVFDFYDCVEEMRNKLKDMKEM